jgi:hypothetical protein
MRRWKWLGFVLIGLGVLALLPLMRGWGPSVPQRQAMMVEIRGRPANEAMQAPRFAGPQREFHQQHERDAGQSGSFAGPELRTERGFGHPARSEMRRHGPWLMGPALLLFMLNQLAALGLMSWLLFLLWKQRGGQQSAPTTPAGHDPRVE